MILPYKGAMRVTDKPVPGLECAYRTLQKITNRYLIEYLNIRSIRFVVVSAKKITSPLLKDVASWVQLESLIYRLMF